MQVAAAVDIGGTTTKVGIVGVDGTILTRARVPTSNHGEPRPLLDHIVTALTPMLAAHRVSGVGVSVAGFLDRGHSAMHGNANLPALCDFPLRQALQARLEPECRLEVDSNASTLAEHRFGAG